MTSAPLKLAAVTAHPLHALVAKLAEVLYSLGSVLDSHQFSNLALAIHFEVSANEVAQLRPSLLGLPLSFSNASLTALEHREAALGSDPPSEIPGSITITFAHREPDLRMHIPAVPG